MNSFENYGDSFFSRDVDGLEVFSNYSNNRNDCQNFGNAPSINIIIVNTPSNYCYPSNYGYNQYQVFPSSNSSPYNYFYSSYQMPISQQPQMYQPPNFYSQPNITKGQKKKSHKTKHHDKKKKKESDKKSKSKSTKGSSEKRQIDCSGGVFKYLFDKCQTNPISHGMIEINGNSYDEDWILELPNIINPSFRSYWLPEEKEYRFFKINFKTFSVKITKYRLRVGDEAGNFLFKSWVLTGIGKDGEKILIDNVNNCTEITRSHPFTTIEVTDKPFVTSIRLEMKGRNENGDLTVDMGNIEIYGLLKYNK